MTTIYYNHLNPFSGISPTPFVGRRVDMLEFGERWAQVETLTLKGVIVPYNDGTTSGIFEVNPSGYLVPSLNPATCFSYNDFINLQQNLIAGFGKDFQPFEIKDGSTSVYYRDCVKVTNISFEQSNYAYSIPYSITLQAYPSGYFSGQYGITDPKEEFNFSQTNNGVLNISHVISARGFNTVSGESNALSNAKTWVNQRTGYHNQIMPVFINASGTAPCLYTQSEIINRLEGTYEIRETYSADTFASGYGLLRYTVDYSVNIDNGISTVSVKGDIVGCRNGTIGQLRSRYFAFDAYQEAINQFYKITGRTDLKSIPVSKGASEDTTHYRLGFEYTFNDDLAPTTSFDYRVEFSYDFENDTISATIDGTVTSRVLIANRWTTVYNYAAQINLYSILLPLYQTYAASLGVTYPLNPVPRSTSRTENKFNYEIGLSATFDNGLIAPLGMDVWDYSIDVNPALHQYSDVPCLEGQGQYIVLDLGFDTRKHVSVQGRAIGSQTSNIDALITSIKQQVLSFQHSYANGARPNLESQNITKTNDSFDLSARVAAGFSCEDAPFTF